MATKVVFTSRRSELTEDQTKKLSFILDGSFLRIIPEEIAWAASGDARADLETNKAILLGLRKKGGRLAGDFPHAALEALHSLPGLFKSVWVRIYAIGGGFKRDTEFQRWGRIA